MTDTEKKKRLVDALERIATTAANAYQRLDDDEIAPEFRRRGAAPNSRSRAAGV